MQQYATSATLYNFGHAGAFGASSATSADQAPARSQAIWDAESRDLGLKVGALRSAVQASNVATKQMILTIIDTQARPPLLQTTALFEKADADGLWTRTLENAVAKQMELARYGYGAALGLSATTGGPVPPTSSADLSKTPAAPGVPPVARAGMGIGTLALLAVVAWWAFGR